MTLGFNQNGTVSSYADGIKPPGGLAAVVHVEQIWPELPLEDKILIVRGLVVKARKCRKMAKKRKYRGDGPMAVGSQRALRYEADECDRVAKTLCGAWGLGWKPRKRDIAPVDSIEAPDPWEPQS